MNRIFKSPDFDKFALKLFSKSDWIELNKFIEILRFNSFLGKPLSFDFLREKKIGGKRVYFLVYNDINIILLVATGDKKVQKKTIEKIKLELSEYKKYVYELYSNTN